ncbi:MAG TPA: FUSC family protein, partial [Streptosporangiaceae bacterium]|nr:FUSC family protein [Streptosporangiaceae bacterium]
MSVRSGSQQATSAPEGSAAGGRETSQPGLRHPVAFLRARDPGLVSVKRSVLAAVVVPAIFAIARAITSNPQVPLFASFGSFALMLFVSIPGTRSDKLRQYLALVAAGALLIVVGSLCSNNDALAIAGMAVAAFVVLFAGVLSPTAALGSTYLLLAFVLPVNVPVPPGQIPARLAGWALAAAAALPVILLVWARPWYDTRRAALATAAERLAGLVQAHAEGHRDQPAHAAAESALHTLRKDFAATPYPPTGLGPSQVAVAKMLSRVEWAGALAVVGPDEVDLVLNSPTARELNAATAQALRCTSAVIRPTAEGRSPGRQAAEELTAALEELHRDRRESLRWAVDRLISQATLGSGAQEQASASALAFVDPTFRSRRLGLATEEIGALALEAAGFPAPPEAAVDVRPAGFTAAARALRQRATIHLTLRSVWLRNSLRGAAALALAVAVARMTDVSHAFWVALGTLSVLRSNALGTGATALRAVAGTVAGFAIGTAIMLGVGGHTGALWFLLPLAVLVAGAAAPVLSFTAGQAGFTVFVIILFNILVPVGWKVGLVRVEDVVLGCAVSVVVGLLFWPRGATAAFGQALCDAYRTGSRALVTAVDRLASPGLDVPWQQADSRSMASYHRLEEAYRQFLAERGAKVIPLSTATHLLTGASRLGLAAHTLATLPVHSLQMGQQPAAGISPASAAVAVAQAEVQRAARRADAWYDS